MIKLKKIIILILIIFIIGCNTQQEQNKQSCIHLADYMSDNYIYDLIWDCNGTITDSTSIKSEVLFYFLEDCEIISVGD